MIEECLWIGFCTMALGFLLLIPFVFAPYTYSSFGKNIAIVGIAVMAIGGLIMIISLLLRI